MDTILLPYIVCSVEEALLDMGYACYATHAEAKAAIVWVWKPKYPDKTFYVAEDLGIEPTLGDLI